MRAIWGVRARRRSGAAVVAAVLAAMVVAPIQQASAASLGGFEIDGNLVVDATGGLDWDGLGGAACVPDGIADPTGYKGSESGDVDSWAQAPAQNGKTDIVAIQTHSAVDTSSNHQWTYVAIQRAATDGSTYFTYEYNQQPNHSSSPKGAGTPASVPTRTTGDVRLQFEQQGQGQNQVLGKIVVSTMDRWVDGQWVAQPISPDAIAGRSNTAAVPGLCGSAQAAPGAFMEVALDLTALAMEPGCDSGGFGTFNVRSRQSASATSELSDVAIGTANIEPNCGSATITKRGPSGAVVGDTALRFEISPDPRDGTGTAYVNDNVTTGLAGNEVADVDDRPGYVSFSTSLFGVYTVTEVAAPTGYLIPKDATATVTIARYSDVPIEITDPLGTGTVLKVDATTGAPLAGAEFTFTKVNDPYQGTVVTVRDNSSADVDPRAGYITAGGLYTGTWEARESDAPSGYLISGTTQRLTVSSATPNPVAQVAFENQQNGQLVWAKVGEDGQTRLSGAAFRLERIVAGDVAQTITITDNAGRDIDPDAGEFHVSGLAFGQWRVVETQAPTGYLPAAPQTYTVNGTTPVVTFSFVNTENGQVTWRKVNEFGDVLDGAGFTLRHDGQVLVVADNTGAAGYTGLDTNPAPGGFAVTGLDFGAWTLSETTVPQGYAAGDPVPFTLSAQSATVDLGDVVNNQDGRVSWVKVGEDGAPLAGAEFTLTQGRQLITVVDNTGQAGYQGADTDERVGRFAVRGLDFGSWSLAESVTPLGYTGLAQPRQLSVSATDQTVDLGEIVNTMNGRLVWSKVDEDGAPLAGATFTLTKGAQVVSVPDNTGQAGYSGQDTNPAVGVFAVEGLDFGTWVLTETVVPQGYAGIAPRNVEVVASQTPILLGAITNTENGQVTWTKVGEHGELLGGAVFELSMDGQHIAVADYTGQAGYQGRDTDAGAGRFSVRDLDFGTWTLTETTAPTGYAGGAAVDFTVTAADSVRALAPVVNTEDGRLVWRKTGEDGTPLAGAGFTLSTDGQSIVVWDNTGAASDHGPDTDLRAGYFTVGGLDFGSWTVTETTVPTGYTGSAPQVFDVTAADSLHQFTFVNSADGRIVWTKVGEHGEALTGATFSLSMGGQTLTVEDNTGQPGYAGFDRDPAPAAYRVVGLDFGTWTLTETDAPTGYRAAAPVQVMLTATESVVDVGRIVNHENGRLAWNKVGEDGSPLAGAGFTLTMGDQQVVVDDFTGQPGYQGADLDPDAGEFLVEGLDFGTWRLEETTVPQGYEGAKPVTVEVVVSDAIQRVEDILNTENGAVVWTKVDEDGELLAGAGFTLTMGGQEVVVDDFTGQAGYQGADRDPVAGAFSVRGLDFGTWTLSETTVPVGYAGTRALTFTVSAAEPQARLGQVTNTENGRVIWSKVDEEDNPLGGAVFELRMDGQVLQVADNTGQSGYSGRDTDARPGEFAVAGLDFGTWTLTETQAPQGYLRDDSTREVEVTASNEAADAGVVVNVAVWATLTADKTAYEFGPGGTQVESDGTVAFGDSVRYGIEVTADGTVPQGRVLVTDALADGLTYRDGSASCGTQECTASYDAARRTVTWSVGSMNPGDVVTVYFVATVQAAPQLAPGEQATLVIDNVAAAGSELVDEAASNTVRVTASASEPVNPTNPDAPVPPTPVVVPTAPHTAPTAQTPAHLAFTGVEGLPQTLGMAALMLVLGAGLWRTAMRRES